jgi:hypothetical protein
MFAILLSSPMLATPGGCSASRDEGLRREFTLQNPADAAAPRSQGLGGGRFLGQRDDGGRGAGLFGGGGDSRKDAGDDEDDAASPLRTVSDQAVGHAAQDRVVVYTAELGLLVNEVATSRRSIEELAREMNGYVEQVNNDGIMIRIPASRFDETMKRIEQLGGVTRRDVKADDVTEEYVDLEARLKNAMLVRDRLKALLEKAENVKAALEVEKELSRIGEEIERLEGKLKYLKSRIAFSTITVTFEQMRRMAPTAITMRLPFRWLQELDPRRLTQEPLE